MNGDPAATERASEVLLVADIGGTYARFGLACMPGHEVTQVRSLRCADYAQPQDAAQAYLAAVGMQAPGARPCRAAFAVAAPLTGEPVRMTNNRWVIGSAGIRSALGLTELTLLNDFEAIALALPVLGTGDLRAIGAGAQIDARLPMAVIGPGTGLGVALCVPAGDRHLALATEGGHATAAASDDFEAELLRRVRRDFEHVSWERLLSGIGLPVLYRAVCEVRGEPALALGAEQITANAQHESDACCVAALESFFAMLGTFAGNVALTGGARGAVFIAGGIALALAERLGRSRFRERFEAKGRYRDYMAGIATCLITAPHGALTGAARALGAPD